MFPPACRGIAGQSGVVDMTETTPGVPLRSPLSDAPLFFYLSCTPYLLPSLHAPFSFIRFAILPAFMECFFIIFNRVRIIPEPDRVHKMFDPYKGVERIIFVL